LVSRLSHAWGRVRRAALAAPGLGVILLAMRNYVLHQSANQAGSLAFSWVLAMPRIRLTELGAQRRTREDTAVPAWIAHS
jgi:hypothetical protein